MEQSQLTPGADVPYEDLGWTDTSAGQGDDQVRHVAGVDFARDGTTAYIVYETNGDDVRIVSPAPAVDQRDILARIDALFAHVQPGPELCACGCRRAVPAGSPTPDFATQGCQRRWHGKRTDNPDDVYRRQDAHLAIEADLPPRQRRDGLITARPPAGEPARPALDLRRVPPEVSAGLQDHGPVHLAYERHCEQCGAWCTPIIGTALADPYAFAADPPPLVQDLDLEMSQHCAECRAEFPGPVYTAEVTQIHDRVHFVLTDGQSRVVRVLTVRELTRPQVPNDVIRHLWRTCERDLTRFSMNFHLRRPGEA